MINVTEVPILNSFGLFECVVEECSAKLIFRNYIQFHKAKHF